MMTEMRTHMKKVMLGTLILVIPSFIFLYGYEKIDKKRQEVPAMDINGETILDTEYYRTKQFLYSRLKSRYQGPLNDRFLEEYDLPNKAIDQLVQVVLLNQLAKKMGVSTSREEVLEAVRASFMYQGRFNSRMYQMQLQDLGMEESVFLNFIRDQINSEKVLRLIMNSPKMTEDELNYFIERQSKKNTIGYIAFLPEDFPFDQEPTDEELLAYSEKYRDKYKIPEKIEVASVKFVPENYIDRVNITDHQIEYYYDEHEEDFIELEKRIVRHINFTPADYKSEVTLEEDDIYAHYELNSNSYKSEPQVVFSYIFADSEKFTDEIEVSEEEIRKNYDDNPEEFEQEEQVHARHIMLRPEEDTEEKRKEVLDKINAIHKEILAGKDFADAANEYTEDPTGKETGGDLRYFPRGRMVKEFEEVAFNLPVGEISEPFETPFGYHIVKVEDHKEAGMLSYEESKENIFDNIKKEKTEDYIKEKLMQLRIQFTPDLTTEDLEEGLIVNTAGPVSQSVDIIDDTIGDDSRMLLSRTFSMEEGEISQPVKGLNGWYLVRILEKRPPAPLSLEDAREQVVKDLTDQEAGKLARQAALKARLNISESGYSMDGIAEDLDLKIWKTSPFGKEGDYVPGVGYPQEGFIGKAFEVSLGEIPNIIETSNGFLLCQLVEIIDERIPELDEVKSKVKELLTKAESQEIAYDYVDNLSYTLEEEKDIIAAAPEANPDATGEIITPAPFAQGDFIPEAGGFSGTFQEEAFKLRSPGDYSGIIADSDESGIKAFYIIQLKEKIPSRFYELEEIHEKVIRDWKTEKALEKTREVAKKFDEDLSLAISSGEVKASTDFSSFKEFVVGKGLSYKTSKPFTGMTGPEKIGTAPALIEFVFNSEPGEISQLLPLIRFDSSGNKESYGYITAQLHSVDEMGPIELAQMTSEFRKQMLQMRQFMVMKEWLENLKEESDVTVYRDKLGVPTPVPTETEESEIGG